MSILVIGGTGLIGSKLVEKLQEAGHEALAASPETGVDTYTGDGLEQAVRDAQVVVDVSNAPNWDDAAVLEFFQRTSRNLMAAETQAGVGHHVMLSVVGADRLPGSGYMRAKLAQEETVKAGSVPFTILRATQFFEFIGRIADSSMRGDAIELPPVLIQPEAAEDVSAVLAEIAVSPPLNGTIEMGGPERMRFDELIRRYLVAVNDERIVRADPHALYFGAELDMHSLTPAADARIAPTRFEDWLSTSVGARARVAARGSS